MPWSAIALACSASSRTASRPPWTIGCNVLTRPSIISGKPVRSLTSFTVSPASRSVLAVPPVETSSTPCWLRARARSTTPVLSETDNRARRMGIVVMMVLAGEARARSLAADGAREQTSILPGTGRWQGAAVTEGGASAKDIACGSPPPPPLRGGPQRRVGSSPGRSLRMWSMRNPMLRAGEDFRSRVSGPS